MGRNKGWSNKLIDDKGRECSKCGEYKPWSDYVKLKNGINGHHSQCRICGKGYANKWYYNNKEKHYDLMKYNKKIQPAGVYQITTREGSYIGESNHIPWRIRQHQQPSQNTPCVGKEVLEWKVLEYVDDPDLRLEREAYYIKKLKPELNTYKV